MMNILWPRKLSNLQELFTARTFVCAVNRLVSCPFNLVNTAWKVVTPKNQPPENLRSQPPI
ncbi:MAG TPA: hypothetical protein DEP05_04100 [Betaproteobacteria bacterium]|nr:hypothetical protein [Betaproteobacteria bacterium]